MNITDVKADIKNKQFSAYYIFTGEEIEVQRIYINKIAETANLPVIRANSVADIWNSLTRPSLFDNKAVYVVRDDKDFQSNEKLQGQLNNDIFNGNILILLLTSVDKRTKLWKAFNERIIVFEHLSIDILTKYIQRDIALNKTCCERLIDICDNDYSRILLEIDKITRYTEVEDINERFKRLVEQGVIYTPPKDAIFDLVDAILLRQVNKVYNLLSQCYDVGEANMVILSVLYTNAKQVLQVQSCDSRDISKSTGLTAWQVKCAQARTNHYSISELVNILRLIQRIQHDIVTGLMEDEVSVKYLLVNIL